MPRESRRPPKRAVLWGIIVWFPFLAIPFSVFFLEVRWQHEIFANDFERHKLGKELRESERQIAEYEQEENRLKTTDSLDAKAMELQLVAPAPGQIETICSDPVVSAQAPQTIPVPSLGSEPSSESLPQPAMTPGNASALPADEDIAAADENVPSTDAPVTPPETQRRVASEELDKP